jgi:hypothetical protein
MQAMTLQNARLLAHQHNYTVNNKVQVLFKIEDDIYSNKYDYEALDAEPVKQGLKTNYRITCIPFVTYGLNKGDIVAVKGNIITQKITDDGQYGYRIAYPSFSDNEKAHVAISATLERVKQAGFEVEEFNDKIAGVNAINADRAVELEVLLNALIRGGAIVAFDTIR